MKVALILFNELDALSMLSLHEPLAALAFTHPAIELEISTCALIPRVQSTSGWHFPVAQVGGSLAGYDWLLIPGGPGAMQACRNAAFLDWLRSSRPDAYCAAVAEGCALLEAANLPGTPGFTTNQVDEALALGRSLAQHLIPKQSQTSPAGSLLEPAQEPAAHRLPRRAAISRRTQETEIKVELNLDGYGEHDIATGIGFLDHMLAHIAVHGMFDLRVTAQGDLHIDVHHTLEDVALALGKAFSQALGERQGIVRTAAQYVPMDEALAFVAIDLSGRPYAVIQAEWHAPYTGTVPNSLWAHFLESFAAAANCNLHARVLYGRDDHHQAEALFKALARALRSAVERDPRRETRVPSTKGTLVA